MEKPELPAQPEEPEIKVLEENFFYDPEHVETQIQDSKVSRTCTGFQ